MIKLGVHYSCRSTMENEMAAKKAGKVKVKPESRQSMLKRIDNLSNQTQELINTNDASAKLAKQRGETVTIQADRINELSKELAELRSECNALKQNLSRALGYIDRINDTEEPKLAVTQPEVTMMRKGPQMLSPGYRVDNNIGYAQPVEHFIRSAKGY